MRSRKTSGQPKTLIPTFAVLGALGGIVLYYGVLMLVSPLSLAFSSLELMKVAGVACGTGCLGVLLGAVLDWSRGHLRNRAYPWAPGTAGILITAGAILALAAGFHFVVWAGKSQSAYLLGPSAVDREHAENGIKTAWNNFNTAQPSQPTRHVFDPIIEAQLAQLARPESEASRNARAEAARELRRTEREIPKLQKAVHDQTERARSMELVLALMGLLASSLLIGSGGWLAGQIAPLLTEESVGSNWPALAVVGAILGLATSGAVTLLAWNRLTQQPQVEVGLVIPASMAPDDRIAPLIDSGAIFSGLSRPPLDKAKPSTHPKLTELLGSVKPVSNLRIRDVNVQASRILPEMCWNADGSAVFLADPAGIVARFPVPSFQKPVSLAYLGAISSATCGRVSLVVGARGQQQLVGFDPDSLDPRGVISIKRPVQQVRSGTSLDLLFVELPNEPDKMVVVNPGAQTMNLLEGKGNPDQPVQFAHLAVAPNGKALYSASTDGTLFRFSISNGVLEKPVRTPTGIPNVARITVALDDELVCVASGVPNGNGICPAAILTTADPKQVRFTIEADQPLLAVGFDPIGQRIYAGFKESLRVFDYDGKPLEAYAFEEPEKITQILVHPKGRQFLLLTSKALRWVEVPAE